MASGNLAKTSQSTGNRRVWTYSAWHKGQNIEDKETTFIDLGFQEGDLINLDNTNKNYKIVDVIEYEITIDLQLNENREAIQQSTIKKLFEL